MKREKPDQSGAMTASEMGRKRWAGVSSEDRKAALAKARAHILLSPEERSRIGRKAIEARWEKWRAEHPGGTGKAKGQAKAGQTKRARRKRSRSERNS